MIIYINKVSFSFEGIYTFQYFKTDMEIVKYGGLMATMV